jgi:hypothetical protein
MKKHPTVRIGSVGEIRFELQLEVAARTADADQGRMRADLQWRSQRIEVQGTFLERLEFEVSGEFADADEPERDVFVIR